MKKIDLTNVQELTKFKNPVGGFICQIVGVEDVPEKEYLRLSYDICEAITPDQKEFVGMYAKRKKERDFDYPVNILSYKESALPFFKGVITALEKSNNGYTWDNDEQKFIGLKIGFVIAEEEYMGQDKNGAPKLKIRTYIAERHSVDAIKSGDFNVPELKKLVQSTVTKPTNPFAKNGAFANTTTESPNNEQSTDVFATVEDDECPF